MHFGFHGRNRDGIRQAHIGVRLRDPHFGSNSVPMAVASRYIRSKPHAPNKSGCHETMDPLQLGVYERHARRDYSICAACTEEHLHIPLTQVCEDPCFKLRKGHVWGSGVRNVVLVDH